MTDTPSLPRNDTPPPASGIAGPPWRLAAAGAFALAVAALLAVAYWEPLKWMVDRWFAPDSYYSHGFLVPLVAAWLIWRDRARLAAQPPGGAVWGLVAVVGGLFILLFSGLLKIYFTGAFSMILVLWGACGFLFGRRVMVRLAFPAFVLTFMVALPLQAIESISFNMKMIATRAAVGLVNGLGVLAVNDGAKIYLENGAVLTVGNACSGLRSLISFLFLGVLFAYLADLSWWRRGVLFAAAMPIAVATNILRVFTLCMVAHFWGESAVQGTVHDVSGYMVFVLAFAMLYGTERLLHLGMRTPSSALKMRNAECGMRNNTDIPHSAFRIPHLRAAAVLVLLALTAAGSRAVLYPELMEQGGKAGRLPLTLGTWTGFESPVEDYVKQILETDDIVERNYINNARGGDTVQLAVAFSSNNRRVAHPPEICYRAGGWEVIDKREVRLEGLPPMIRLLMDSGNRRRDVIFYFYKSGMRLSASYYGQQINIAVGQLLGQPTASSLLRFSSTIRANEDEGAAERRLLDFIRLMVPEIRKSLN